MSDLYETAPASLTSQVEASATVTPADGADLDVYSKAILVDVSGTVKVTYISGVTDTVTLAAGVWHPMRVKRIWATGTTATGIHNGYK